MKQYKEIHFKATSSFTGCKSISMLLLDLGNGDFETLSGTVIHIFEKIPFMRDIYANKNWFTATKYHFN